jgi:hypothetical protein
MVALGQAQGFVGQNLLPVLAARRLAALGIEGFDRNRAIVAIAGLVGATKAPLAQQPLNGVLTGIATSPDPVSRLPNSHSALKCALISSLTKENPPKSP